MFSVPFRLMALLDCINGLLKGWLHISIWEKSQPWKLHSNTYWYDLAKFQLFENVIMSKECVGNVFKTGTNRDVLWCQVLDRESILGRMQCIVMVQRGLVSSLHLIAFFWWCYLGNLRLFHKNLDLINYFFDIQLRLALNILGFDIAWDDL